jgi:hypothetical protein
LHYLSLSRTSFSSTVFSLFFSFIHFSFSILLSFQFLFKNK